MHVYVVIYNYIYIKYYSKSTSSSAITNAQVEGSYMLKEKTTYVLYRAWLLKIYLCFSPVKMSSLLFNQSNCIFHLHILFWVIIEKTKKKELISSQKKFLAFRGHFLFPLLALSSVQFLKNQEWKQNLSWDIRVCKLQMILWALYIDIPQPLLYNTSTEL